MTVYTIEIHPKRPQFDPLARRVKSELLELGEIPAKAVVSTNRLFRLEGDLAPEQARQISETLLVDPVVETWKLSDGKKEGKGKARKATGFVVDVWPKPGVTDPVGETVEKGVKDLGVFQEVRASSAFRYVFPKVSDSKILERLAQRSLANELIHDIHIRKAGG